MLTYSAQQHSQVTSALPRGLPGQAGNDDVGERSRDAFASAELSRVGDGFASSEAFPFCFPRKRGKRSTEWCTWRLPGTVVGTAPVTGNSRGPCYRAAHLSALHCGL